MLLRFSPGRQRLLAAYCPPRKFWLDIPSVGGTEAAGHVYRSPRILSRFTEILSAHPVLAGIPVS
ncbi:hypothetical protein GCM10027052_30210 [Parafrigoribacterium mesophilum]